MRGVRVKKGDKVSNTSGTQGRVEETNRDGWAKVRRSDGQAQWYSPQQQKRFLRKG